MPPAEDNPYITPGSNPVPEAAPVPEPPHGQWLVKDGLLWVRRGVVQLPEIDLMGTNDQPLARRVRRFRKRTGWFGMIFVLPLLPLFASVTHSPRSEFSAIAGMLAVVFFVAHRIRAPRSKLLFHASRGFLRRVVVKWAGVVVTLAAIGWLGLPVGHPYWGFYLSVFFMFAGLMVAIAGDRTSIHSRGYREGWFALSGIHPNALLKLAAHTMDPPRS